MQRDGTYPNAEDRVKDRDSDNCFICGSRFQCPHREPGLEPLSAAEPSVKVTARKSDRRATERYKAKFGNGEFYWTGGRWVRRTE